jgi:hypothetical protein
MKKCSKKNKPHLVFPLYIDKNSDDIILKKKKQTQKLFPSFFTPLFNDTATKRCPKAELKKKGRKKREQWKVFCFFALLLP